MLPSSLPGLDAYPSTYRFFQKHLDMQFDDVRTMLRLPLPEQGLTGGCNFAAVAILFNLLLGISEVLYTPKAKTVAEKFKELLVAFYPWEPGDRRSDVAGLLYNLARIPLTHYLGTSDKRGAPRIHLDKGALSQEQIVELESSTSRPAWLPPFVVRKRKPGRLEVSVAGLYWGTFQLLGTLVADQAQMQLVERRLDRMKL